MRKIIYIFLVILCFSGCNKTSNIVFFYSNQCPHCAKVIAFFNADKIRDKVVFIEKEVSQNRKNLMELVKMQKRCGIPVTDYVEVPLLWTGTKCITGDQDIIKFFSKQIDK